MFGQFSAPAIGCGSLYSAPAKWSQSNTTQSLRVCCSCVGLGHPPLQPLAAEALISHQPNGRELSCSCVGLGRFPLQPYAEAFFPQQPDGRNATQRSPCVFLFLCGFGKCSAPAVCGSLYSAPAKLPALQCNAVLAFSCSCVGLDHFPLQPWLRKPLFRNSQTWSQRKAT